MSLLATCTFEQELQRLLVMNCYTGIDMTYGLVRSYMCARKNVRSRQKTEGALGQHAQSGLLLLDPSDSFGILRIEVSPYCIPDPIRSGSNSPTERIVNEMSLERDARASAFRGRIKHVHVRVNRNRLHSIIHICLQELDFYQLIFAFQVNIQPIFLCLVFLLNQLHVSPTLT